METITTKSASETQALGEEFAQKIKDGGVLCLYGDLGSGKTTFVQGLAKGLGVSRRISSPTFIIVRTYELNTKDSQLFYHIDLYRCETENDLKGIGMQEILTDPKNVVVIEWPEKLGTLLPKKRIDIRFEYINEEQRKIIIV